MQIIKKIPKEKILIDGYKKFKINKKYNILTFLFFPLVIFYSKKYQHKFFNFCFEYQKSGTFFVNENKKFDINSFEYHYYDCEFKDITKYGYPINFKKENCQEFFIKNNNGQNISCLTILNPNNNGQWVIGFHGWTENKYLALRLVSHFYKKGYNILTFDSMGHGKSYGQYTDIGLTTAQDVNCLIDWLKANYQLEKIGLIGNSMGSSTINYYMQNYYLGTDISWTIIDSGFSDLLAQFRFVMQYRYQKPWWLTTYNLAKNYKKITNCDISNYELLTKSSKTFKVPTLLIHGKTDTFVPFFMSNEIDKIEKNNLNYNSLFLDNINHVLTLCNAHEQYSEKIDNFLKKYNI